MEPFTFLRGIVVPIDRPNVDTDAIIPKQYLKSIKRSGFGANLFDEWRYLDYGEPGDDCTKRRVNPEFVLNQPRYANARILLARENFGCGSSREHAVWALADFGIRCVIGSSFADIFYSNCGKNGVLAVKLSVAEVDALFSAVLATSGAELEIDLNRQTVTDTAGRRMTFEINSALKARLLAGLDDIGLTLQHAAAIREYETDRRDRMPWL